MKIRLTVVALLALSVLTACATPRPRFEKPGVADAERRRDEAECAKQSMSVDGPWRGLGPYRIDREAYESCLRSRGYQLVNPSPRV